MSGAPGTTRPTEARGAAYVEILVIRHGQSHNNAVYAAQGTSVGRLPDPPLTVLGQAQARALGAAFAAGDFPVVPTVLHASLMTRAIQTAAPIADAVGLPVLGRADVFEVGGPLDWSGHEDHPRRPHSGSGSAVLAALTERLVLPAEARPDGWWGGPVEAESGAAERAARVIEDLRERYGGTTEVIAVVSHEWFSQFLFRELLGLPLRGGWIDLNNTGVTRFRNVEDPSLTSVSWTNRTTHLRPDQLSG